MALIVATGFVVDDAIVVLENVTRHVEAGMPRFEAAIQGAKEVGFTVLSMSLSLIAVFIPILAMGGLVGRLFREFSVTLSVAVLISLLVSLTTTPMMCSRLIRRQRPGDARGGCSGRASARSRRCCTAMRARCAGRCATARCSWCCWRRPWSSTSISTSSSPRDSSRSRTPGASPAGSRPTRPSPSSRCRRSSMQFMNLVKADPAVDTVVGFTGGGSQGGGQTNSGFVFISLKPKAERKLSADQVIARLRPKLNQVAGARLFLQAVQDIRTGGRQSNAQYQYTLQADNVADIYKWAPKVAEALQRIPSS